MKTSNYEKLGAFYLGRSHDLQTGETSQTPLLYDSRDLTTHAVCVGMTGSGKTGLCISLLEEAAIDGIPALVIDPKGDLGNLMLTFPRLEAEEFRPWVQEDDARRKGITVDELAVQQAKLWREGLASWDQDAARIARLRQAADFTIYTPGSSAGLPVSILSSLDAPPDAVIADGDALRERISSMASSLLTLMGIDADPVQSREHILLSNLFDHAWRRGQGLDLAGLIQAIQSPPIERIGVMEIESFFPAKERFALSMRINNLLAAPSFQAWLSGESLDIQRLLHDGAGRPRISIFSIAHLSDSERMFFVSLLLNQTLGWMRSKPGSTSLRALLYMDEIFGYIPPTAEPPSKKPFLTLLKQARAYGLGLVLATQNPVDLDYKGLSNAGTWFLGRLQTERDKMRVLDGLEGIAAAGEGLDRGAIDKVLSSLGKRVFLMHNVHDVRPTVFHTRWAMSYLRGPLTRSQIQQLMQRKKAALAGEPVAKGPGRTESGSGAKVAAGGAARPLLPPSIPQVFMPAILDLGQAPMYCPGLVGLSRVQFVDRKTKKLKQVDEPAFLLKLGGGDDIDWQTAEAIDLGREDLESEPELDAPFQPLPTNAERSRSYTTWKKKLADHLYRTCSADVMKSKSLGLVSDPGESESDFRVRLADQAREKRDRMIEQLRKKYTRKVSRLEDRIRRAQQTVEKEDQQAKGQKMQTVISLGTTLLSAFLGSKRVSLGTLGRAQTTARGVGRVSKERQDVQRAQQNLSALERQLLELNAELEQEIDQLEDRLDPLTEELEVLSLRPRRSDVEVRLVALGWRLERGD